VGDLWDLGAACAPAAVRSVGKNTGLAAGQKSLPAAGVAPQEPGASIWIISASMAALQIARIEQRAGGAQMVKRRSKKSVARKVKRRISGKKAVPRKMKRGYNIHPGKPTGREVQAMHRLQVLTERYIGEGLTPADARTRATEELRANPRGDVKDSHDRDC